MIHLVLARIRVACFALGMMLVLTSPLHHLAWIPWVGAVMVLLSVATTFIPGGVDREPVPMHSPVTGRWIAVNSPADKIPSHGVQSAGQTYAIDLLYWPDAREPWKSVHRWPLARKPQTFPGFGQPICAPADGRVVRTRGWWRDHWSRNSWPALLYLFLEGSARELIGPGALLGNHVVLDVGDGNYAVLAHLKRGSIKVKKGRAVRAGQQLAECGNSGNSSEPHVHFQVMDTPRAAFAAGLPFRFAGHEMPKTGEPLVSA
jgi:hypothetical protein